MGLTTDTLAHEINTMSYVVQCVHAIYLENMGFIIDKIGVCLDGGSHLVEIGSLFQFYIHHAAVYALTYRNGHGKCIFHASLRTHANAVSHGTTRTEIGVRDAFGGKTLHEGAHDTVASWIPTCGDNADGTTILSCLVERAT